MALRRRAGASVTIAHAVLLDDFSSSPRCDRDQRHHDRVGRADWAIRERVSGVEFHILALASSAGAILMTQANDSSSSS